MGPEIGVPSKTSATPLETATAGDRPLRWLIGLQALSSVVLLGSAVYLGVTTARLAQRVEQLGTRLGEQKTGAETAAKAEVSAETLQTLAGVLDRAVTLYAAERTERAALAAELKSRPEPGKAEVSGPPSGAGSQRTTH